MNRAFTLYDFALGAFFGFAHVALDHHQAFHHGAILLGQELQNLAALAFFLAGENNDFLASFNVCLSHFKVPPEQVKRSS